MSSSDMTAGGLGAGSGTPPSARVELAARIASLELSVVGSDFRPLATGMGRLSAEVPAGIYQIVARAGPIVERTLVSLAPGEVHRNDEIAISFPAAAPVESTSTSHEYHQYAAEQATRDIGQADGPPSALVIVVRDVRGLDGPPLEDAELACFQLLDQSLAPLPGFDQGWKVNGPEAVATWSGRLLAGGYALRTDPSRSPGGARRPATAQAYDQSIWVSPGWQTVVFITTGPGGPQTSAASIHMAGLEMGWSPYEVDVGLALELACWGLRQGRSVLPDDLLGVLLNTKFINPMLGVVGAHSLLLRQAYDRNLLEVVLGNLEGMLPDHPDVLALRAGAASRHAGDQTTPGTTSPAASLPAGDGVRWPPMLLSAYRSLIRLDATDPGVIGDRSPAELAAGHLLVQGIWTSWTPLPPQAALPAGPPLPHAALPAGPPSSARADGAPAVGVLPLLGARPELIESLPVEDPATARIASYLRSLAALEGPGRRVEKFATLSPQEISLATTLPAATVDRALDNIARLLLPPPSGPPPPPGRGPPPVKPTPGPSNLLLLLVGGVILLAGAGGAVALCAGSPDCQRLIGRGESTPGPTEAPSPTAEPTRRPPLTRPPPTPTPPRPVLMEVPGGIEFGSIVIGADDVRPLEVTTSSSEPVDFAIVDDLEGVFAVEPACTPVQVGDQTFSCSVGVTFAPQEETLYEGLLEVIDPGTGDAHPVRLIGRGEPLPVRIGSPVEFGSVYVLDTSEQEVTAYAEQSVPLHLELVDATTGAFATEPSCDWQDDQQGVLACTFTVTFTPPVTGQHTATLAVLAGGVQAATIQLVGSGYIIL